MTASAITFSGRPDTWLRVPPSSAAVSIPAALSLPPGKPGSGGDRVCVPTASWGQGLDDGVGDYLQRTAGHLAPCAPFFRRRIDPGRPEPPAGQARLRRRSGLRSYGV